jgi:hypothetical protein
MKQQHISHTTTKKGQASAGSEALGPPLWLHQPHARIESGKHSCSLV